MKKTTKILSLLLTFVMIIAMAVPMTVSASFTDVGSNHHYYEAIHNLAAEGILDGMGDGTFAPESPVTRAQFTKVICYALSVGDITYSDAEKSIFTDVIPGHWAADNILTAYKLGIINGMGDGTFAPDVGVNYEQAVKMVVCALYNSPSLEYPNGYMGLASSAKLLKNINDAKMYQPMTRGAVAQLIDNMRSKEITSEDGTQGSLRDETSTSRKFEGQLISGYDISIRDGYTSPCLRNEIEVEGTTTEIFDVSELDDFDINDYLGKSIIVYYDVESGVDVAVATSISLQPKKNEEVKINFDLICDYTDSYIEYYTDEYRTETEKAYYSSTADVLFNGQPTSKTIEELVSENLTKSGKIVLLSSGTKNTADVAFVKSYDTMIVSYVNTTEKKVYDLITGGNIILDVNDRNKDVSITLNGNDYALSSIRENNILSVAKSENGKIIEVLVSNTIVSGMIVSVSTNPVQITLDKNNSVYTLSPSVYGAADQVEAGKHVTFTLDAFGKVARIAFTAGETFNYGYISAAEKSKLDDNVIKVKLYKPRPFSSTLEGTICEFASRINVNGRTYTVEKDAETIMSILFTDAQKVNPSIKSPSNTDYSQPIRYTQDSTGKINAIITNSYNVGDAGLILNLDKLTTGLTTGGSIECTLDATNFGSSYRISSNTPIIYIPADRIGGTYYSKANSFFEEDKKYYVQFANVSSTGVVSCVYLYDIDGGSIEATEAITEDTKPMVVKEIIPRFEYNGEFYKKFTLLDITSGTDVECYDEDIAGTEILDTLSVGDVVRTVVNDEKFVEAVEVLAVAEDVKNKTFEYSNGVYIKTQDKNSSDEGTQKAKFRTFVGLVKVRENYEVTFVPGYDVSADGESYTASSSTPVYIVDTTAVTEDNKVKKASVLDLEDVAPEETAASKVMVYTSEISLKAIVIFK